LSDSASLGLNYLPHDTVQIRQLWREKKCLEDAVDASEFVGLVDRHSRLELGAQPRLFAKLFECQSGPGSEFGFRVEGSGFRIEIWGLGTCNFGLGYLV